MTFSNTIVFGRSRKSGLTAARAILVAATFLALSACTRTGGAPEAAGSSSTVRFSIAADPQTLDPLFAHADASSVEQQLARLVFEPFLDIDAHGRTVPVLLARVPTTANGDLSRDGRTIVYRLRPGARWQDGVPVTARDVLFTLHAIADDRNPVRSREGYDRIARAERIDDHTVRVVLKAPWAPAVATLFSYGTAPQYVLPAHLLEREARLDRAAFGDAPLGDGPYRFTSWDRGNRLTYTADPHYWRGAPAVAQLDVRVIPDPGANFTALQSGALDWNLVSPVQWQSLRGGTGLAFRYVPLALIAGVALNTTHPPLDDPAVRRAIAASIDRRAISDKLTFGRYQVVDTAQPLSSWARDPHVHLPAFDPAAADRALDAAGWHRGPDGVRVKNGRRLALTYVQFPESQTGVRAADFIERALHDRGLDLTLKSVTNAKLFLPRSQGGTLASGDFDMAYVPWPMGADPDDSFLLTCDGPANYMRWCDPAVDALEARALIAPSRAERKDLYGRIEARVAAAVPIVYLFNPSYVYAYRPALGGFAPNAFNPTWNASDWRLGP
jgi:peptide/nickel transport system substrate-binding protein